VIQRQLKLQLTKAQQAKLEGWLWHLTGVYNWAVRKIGQDAQGGIYYSSMGFHNLLAGHSRKMEIPSHVIQGVLSTVYAAWQRCFRGLGRKPRLKSQRNRMNSIPFPDPIKSPSKTRGGIPGLGSVRFHKQTLPEGRIKCGRIVRRASGWYLCLFIDAAPNKIPHVANGVVGIDPGFKHLLTLSTGEKVEHPRELEVSARRLAQAQRGDHKQLARRIQERIQNQRKDRNHKLSRRLVSENQTIVFSKDRIRAVAKKFGKSVTSSGHGALREMLRSKAVQAGREFIAVDSKNSTRTCSSCGAFSGPRGFSGLKVRNWECACGARHDRDRNAAINTLRTGLGCSHEIAVTLVRNANRTLTKGR
jgi:putative transposase